MAAIRSNTGGQLLNQYLVARIFAFDDDQSDEPQPAREPGRRGATKQYEAHNTTLRPPRRRSRVRRAPPTELVLLRLLFPNDLLARGLQ